MIFYPVTIIILSTMFPKLFFISILLYSLILSHSYKSQCLDYQKSLLLKLKNELIFNSTISTNLVEWSHGDDDCCEWYGVECDDAGYVINLELDFEGISGGLEDSSSLFRLEYLEKLNLAYNVFNCTTIPKGIQNLTYLTHLNLSNAAFCGQVPPEMLSLRRLVSLDISNLNPRISEPLKLESPNLESFIRKLTGLKELYLDGINVTSSDEWRKWSHIISSYVPNITALSLRRCSLSGPLAESFSQLHSLSILQLDLNHLSTVVPDMFANFSTLTTLTLFGCGLKGSFLDKIFRLPSLQNLDLVGNELTGGIPPFSQTNLSNLVYLDLGFNSFSGNVPQYLFDLPSLQKLNLAHNNFFGLVEEFSVVNVSNVASLDLRHNQLEGPIPDSFFQLESLESLLLSGNSFNGTFRLDKIQSLPNLTRLDLSYNNLSIDSSTTIGRLPHYNLSIDSSTTIGRLPQLKELGLASCNLSVFPDFIIFFDMTRLDLSNNRISGNIQNFSPYLCNATNLVFLDLSVNKLSGSIPSCLLEKTYVVILGQNNLSGHIADNFSSDCRLYYLDLNNNVLEGKIPKSIENCKWLNYMNVGNNMINDTFPCMLSSSLIVLVLHSNRFHGEVTCHNIWPHLQVIDISSNNFGGSLKSINFSSLRAMAQLSNNFLYYSATVRLTMKGLELEYARIWPDFGIIDLSSNNFNGEIPNVIGDLSLLHHLNLSHNALNGSIPKSFGQLKKLESLDLSVNQIAGAIPVELSGLTFLSFLNVSYNKLVGEIPNGRHLQTFSADSFRGNPGLCGFNLDIECSNTKDNGPFQGEDEQTEEKEIKWEYVCAALGYVVGLGCIAWLLLFCRSFRQKYFDKIDEVVEEIFEARDRRRRKHARTIGR